MSHDSPLAKKVSSIIEESVTIPMWGKVPAFPWESFCLSLKEALKIPSLSLTPTHADWKEEEQLLKGLGKDPMIASFIMAPLSPSLFWVMSKEDIEKLSRIVLDKEKRKNFSEIELQKGFFQFNFLHILKAFDHLKIYEGLSPKILFNPLSKDKAYCVDVTINASDEKLFGRLICPQAFHQVFTSHFSSKPFSLNYVDSSLELTLKVQIGKVKLPTHEWDEVRIGDYVILDQCSYHPHTKQGSLIITLETIPLLIAKHKHNELKILDYILYNQEDSFMIEDTPSHEEDDMEEEFEEEEEDFEEDEEFEEEEETDEEETPSSENEASIESVLSYKEIPLSLCVEIAHIKMSLNQLLTLKPGNTLQLPLSIDQGVTITLNSKVIARGELLQIGDLLGVKISEISH
jgi:flagellar motor switch protein FliN/FliY